MTDLKQPSITKIISVTAAIIVALQTIGGFIGSSWLNHYIDDRVDAKIHLKEQEYKKKSKEKKSFRELIAPKIGLDEDEIHIKIGKDHKTEDAFRTFTMNKLDSLDLRIKKVEKSNKNMRKEIIYYHPGSFLYNPLND